MDIDTEKPSYWELVRIACLGTTISVAIAVIVLAFLIPWG